MGAWIEIATKVKDSFKATVAPLVGAWIEIIRRLSKIRPAQSLLSWERGLKSVISTVIVEGVEVAPLVGAWIEILTTRTSLAI